MEVQFLCLLIFIVFGGTHGLVLGQKFKNFFSRNVLEKFDFNKTSLGDDVNIYTATMNDYGEELVANVNALLKSKGFDPYPVDDVYKGYWWGHLKLNNIHIDGLSTMYRSGDNIFTYDHRTKILRMDMTLGFENLEFGCKYKAKLFGIGPSGSITGRIDNIEMLTSILIDYNYDQAVVNKYRITNSGHISIKLHGLPIVDQFADLILNASTAIFKSLIYDVVDSMILSILESAVEVIDALLKLLLG